MIFFFLFVIFKTTIPSQELRFSFMSSKGPTAWADAIAWLPDYFFFFFCGLLRFTFFPPPIL